MKIIDLHCDTFMKLFKNKNKKFKNNDYHIDINKLIKGDSLAQFFAMFIYKNIDYEKKGYDSIFELTLDMIDYFHQQINKYDKVEFASDIDDLNKNEKANKISAFLTLEEGGVVGNDLNKIKILYETGVRAITLTWNFPNTIGYPNCKEEYQSKGLTRFGKDAVRMMNDLGILIDVSHLSDGGFYDVLEISNDPFIATHSNARNIHNHSRNLTDRMIKEISESGGVIGINFCAAFLAENEISKISDILNHINHIKKIGGAESIAIGSDFDGIDCGMEIEDYSHIQKLVDALKKNGYSEREIEQIAYKNAKRVIKQVL
ncbi:MAG: membrane dipeptidase [Candidatus Mcinerneyibacterium aminivorans]|uniref:Membrane dipeptidase n=1 Tax=Candidatus Mcinerneyibacterium aminivorans TaxID=2703815 RepID=A0A5D0MC54_9BACT|nr:MAG: membrane dipeptidase [Candidatus Mcinerneyibacterium aminivorans]